jgi:hypothetical protein
MVDYWGNPDIGIDLHFGQRAVLRCGRDMIDPYARNGFTHSTGASAL